MVAKRTHPFDEAAINEMAHAFAVALRRPDRETPATRRLDTSQVVDRRGYQTPTQKRMKALAKRGVFDGDGRVERPAPRYGASSRDDYAAGSEAGASDRPRVQQHAKPKPKPKRIFNQGRHDG